MYKKVLLTILSIMLICSIAVNLTGCATKVQAAVMEGINANAVTGKASDDAFAQSQMRLALDLFQSSVLERKNENVLISPLSIRLALAMTADGADGEARDEMESLLGGEISLEDLNEYLNTYVNNLPSAEKYKLQIANSIGMPSAFSGGTADFSKMAHSSRGYIYIGDVLHKTFISVDELGTKAGAVAKVQMNDESAPMSEWVVTLNRPFVYMIIDNETNLPVFIGTAMDIQNGPLDK